MTVGRARALTRPPPARTMAPETRQASACASRHARACPGRALRPRARRPDAHLPLALAALLAWVPLASAHSRTPADPRAVAILQRADSLSRSWRADSALALLEPLLAEAGRHGDRNLAMEVQLRRAAGLGLTGRAARSEAAARPAMELAAALRDSAVHRTALRWLAYSYLARMRLDEATRYYTRLLALAVPADDARNEGFARTALAYADLAAGRLEASRDGYRKAVGCMERAGDERAALTPLVGLARAQAALGEFAQARRSYEAIVRLAGRLDARMPKADAINNLGTLEYQVGDPAQAVRRWRQAVAIYRQLGATEEMQRSATNVAIAEADLGHFDEAVSRLEALLALNVEQDHPGGQIHALLQLASIRSTQGRHEESIRLLRRCLAMRGGLEPEYRFEALLRISSALGAQGRGSEGLAVLMREADPLRSRLSVESRVRLDLQTGHLLRELGRPGQAHASFVRAERSARASGLAYDRLDALTGEGRCDWDLGRADSARSVLQRAERLWETERRVPTDPEWRVRRGELAEELCFALGRALLPPRSGVPDSVAVADAYDVLQRFKARTLLERMAGPAGSLQDARSPVTLLELQRRVLAEGQLLLDVFVGHEDALLFAITTREVRVVHLPAADSLAAAVRLYREIVATPPASASDPALDAVRRRAARGLSRRLLGEVADLVAISRRLIVAPDGPLNGIAFGELPLATGGPADESALIEHRQVIRVPSATLLAGSRAPAPTERAILALGGATDGRGRPLPGAVDEARALGRGFAGTDVRIFGTGHSAPLRPRDLGRYQVLHLAAHTMLDDQRPWNSGVLLGPAAREGTAGDDGAVADPDSAGVDADPWLRANAIASMRLPASLAVLSCCESGGGRVAWGEGVQGLGTAFMSAGVRAVVVTLWPVDDRVSAALMRDFYAGLARGETAAYALQQAQLGVAHRSATRLPFYWAGYVLIGDGDVRVALARRFPFEAAIAVAAAALALLGVWFAWSRRAGRGAPARGVM